MQLAPSGERFDVVLISKLRGAFDPILSEWLFYAKHSVLCYQCWPPLQFYRFLLLFTLLPARLLQCLVLFKIGWLSIPLRLTRPLCESNSSLDQPSSRICHPSSRFLFAMASYRVPHLLQTLCPYRSRLLFSDNEIRISAQKKAVKAWECFSP